MLPYAAPLSHHRAFSAWWAQAGSTRWFMAFHGEPLGSSESSGSCVWSWWICDDLCACVRVYVCVYVCIYIYIYIYLFIFFPHICMSDFTKKSPACCALNKPAVPEALRKPRLSGGTYHLGLADGECPAGDFKCFSSAVSNSKAEHEV